MLLTYRNVFPFAIALIGGIIVATNQPDIAIAQSGYVPPGRKDPQRTQGGGSRLKTEPVELLSLKGSAAMPVSANLSVISLRQNACIHQSENLVTCDRFDA